MNINKADVAYEKIKNSILTQKFPPKFHLKELELSEMLNLSRTPIREAIHKLAAEGFVDENENQISTVSDISLDKFIEIFQVRDALETKSIALATKNWTDKNDILEIKNILTKQMEYAEVLDNEITSDLGVFWATDANANYLKYDKLFHLKLAHISDNNLLYNEMIKILDLYYRYNHFSTVKNRCKIDVYEHTEIFEAVSDRNVRLAIELMQSHLQSVKESVLIGINRSNSNY